MATNQVFSISDWESDLSTHWLLKSGSEVNDSYKWVNEVWHEVVIKKKKS